MIEFRYLGSISKLFKKFRSEFKYFVKSDLNREIMIGKRGYKKHTVQDTAMMMILNPIDLKVVRSNLTPNSTHCVLFQ